MRRGQAKHRVRTFCVFCCRQASRSKVSVGPPRERYTQSKANVCPQAVRACVPFLTLTDNHLASNSTCVLSTNTFHREEVGRLWKAKKPHPCLPRKVLGAQWRTHARTSMLGTFLFYTKKQQFIKKIYPCS